MFLLNSGSGSVFSVLQSPVSREETEGVISRHARSLTAALGDVPGGEKGPRDAWEIPVWVLVRIWKFSWIGGTMSSQPSVFLEWFCLSQWRRTSACVSCVPFVLSYL